MELSPKDIVRPCTEGSSDIMYPPFRVFYNFQMLIDYEKMKI